MSGTQSVCQGNWYTYTLNVPGNHQAGYTYQWIKPSNWGIQNQGANWITLSVPQYSTPDYGLLQARVNNGCGYSQYTGFTVYPGYCGGYYLVSPNPSKDYIDVLFVENMDTEALNQSQKNSPNTITSENDAQLEIKIFDEFQGQVFEEKISTLGGRINIADIPKGSYFLHINDGEKLITKHIFIE